MKIHVVWQSGGSYEPSFIIAFFTNPEHAEAYAKLHDGGNEDTYYTGEYELDNPTNLALIERGTRPWLCTYYYEPGEEWDPEGGVMASPIDPVRPQAEPTMFRYMDYHHQLHETWEVTVIEPTAEKARQSAGEWIRVWNDQGLGEVKDGQ